MYCTGRKPQIGILVLGKEDGEELFPSVSSTPAIPMLNNYQWDSVEYMSALPVFIKVL